MSWWKRFMARLRGRDASSVPVEGHAAGCDHAEVELRQGTAKYELFVATGEIETGHDLRHGAGHVANLISYDPGNPVWLALLDRYLAATPDPESLFPRGDKAYFSTEAVRACIWHRQGKLQESIELLGQIVQAKPDAQYLEAWGLLWLEPPGRIESLPESLCLSLFASALNRFPEARLCTTKSLREVQRWARLCERFAIAHPGQGPLTMCQARLFRKAGLFEEALEVLRALPRVLMDWHSAVALGLVLREVGGA